jgi:hypothetical protein
MVVTGQGTPACSSEDLPAPDTPDTIFTAAVKNGQSVNQLQAAEAAVLDRAGCRWHGALGGKSLEFGYCAGRRLMA